MTKSIVLVLAVMAGLMPTLAGAGVFSDAGAVTIAAAVPLLISAAAGYALAQIPLLSERFAAPARKKPAQDRTLLDRGAIAADALIDAQIAKLDRSHLQEVLSNYILENLRGLGDLKALDPARAADGMVTDFIEKLERRNPVLAQRAGLSVRSATELLTAAIQRTALDPLAEALKGAVGSGVTVRSVNGPAV